MPNPYYIAPRGKQPLETALDVGRFGAQLYGLKQTGQALTQREEHFQTGLPIREQQAKTAHLQAKTAGVRARTAGTLAGIAEADPMNVENELLGRNFGERWPEIQLAFAKKLKIPIKDLQGIAPDVFKYTQTLVDDPKIDNAKGHALITQNASWIEDKISEGLTKATEDETGKWRPDQKQLFGQIKTALAKGKNEFIVGLFFPQVHPIIKNRQALAEATIAGKVGKPPTLYKTEKGFLPADRAVGLMPPSKEATPTTDIQKFKRKMSIANTRKDLSTGKDDQEIFNSISQLYNTENKRNEVAYWKTGGVFTDEETKFVKLSKEAIKAGWTPTKVQEAANTKGMTTEAVLRELGLIK